jgi:hypothetical protein
LLFNYISGIDNPALLAIVADHIATTVDTYVDEERSIASKQHGARMKSIAVLELEASIQNTLIEARVVRIRDFKHPERLTAAYSHLSEQQQHAVSEALASYAGKHELMSWLNSPPMSP